MATNSLGGDNSPFNRHDNIDAVCNQDDLFWRLHETWRAFEDEFETSAPPEHETEKREIMLDRATGARDSMFLCPVRTASALKAKLEAIREGDAGSVIEMDLATGVSVFDVIQADCERLVRREMSGSSMVEVQPDT